MHLTLGNLHFPPGMATSLCLFLSGPGPCILGFPLCLVALTQGPSYDVGSSSDDVANPVLFSFWNLYGKWLFFSDWYFRISAAAVKCLEYSICHSPCSKTKGAQCSCCYKITLLWLFLLFLLFQTFLKIKYVDLEYFCFVDMFFFKWGLLSDTHKIEVKEK